MYLLWFQSTSDSVLTGPLHNRSNSTTSLNTTSWSSQSGGGGGAPMKGMGRYGKPNVAPKPPGIAAKSPGTVRVNGRTNLPRTQSMRAPRSPPAAPPQGKQVQRLHPLTPSFVSKDVFVLVQNPRTLVYYIIKQKFFCQFFLNPLLIIQNHTVI